MIGRRRRPRSLLTVLFVLVLLASAKRSASPGEQPGPVVTTVIGVFDLLRSVDWPSRLLTAAK
ncbi:hypothetical protein V5P93_003227 [Actinokineospora auranticolor]|uniref:Uncharacterized protein n=1 Tax=Actinokineospora auranticolor TaxID=155976 RepID=A0A2S6H1L8_9PSEU|nr:hypothetical protein [Actinokineospora auranticolor]PPK71362.1 hypothetical protein CLV40_101552 [Actinokineospora auranticolor]